MREYRNQLGVLAGTVVMFLAVQPLQAAVSEAGQNQSRTDSIEQESSQDASHKRLLAQTPDVLVPNPEITIDGDQVPVVTPRPDAAGEDSQLPPAVPTPTITIDGEIAPTPTTPAPYLPRAVAPPVGDIAVSNIDATPDLIDLGTPALVPRLVLRDAPAREVLAVLARFAGLNLVFTDGQGEAAVEGGPTISLDLENEPVQEVFNSVLLVSGLNANRRGNSIFVGPSLPDTARNLVSRTLRLNQADVENAAAFLAALGAEVQVYIESTRSTIVESTEVNGVATTSTREQTEPPKFAPLTPQRTEETKDLLPAPLLLRGLLASTDSRLNSITLTGEPRKVQLATSFLAQLDARRRQVAVNVKVIDVNLLNTENFNSSFSFGIDDSFFVQDDGAAALRFGDEPPVSSGDIINNSGLSSFADFPRKFLALIESQIISGNAKILTDPTLVVQEGQVASVQLTQEVFAGTELVARSVGEEAILVDQPIIKDAGLTLAINVSRVDDNGFVALSVNPTVSSIGGSQNTPVGVITLLQERTVNSGEIRVRDGQTLILSGIIQESDRTSVSKVPILGDIPLLGALFRSTDKQKERREVIVLLTPQIVDENSNLGYNYTPGSDARDVMRQQGLTVPGNP